MLRHMAAELKRKASNTIVLALHPGEVSTDMAKDVDLEWEVEGQLTPTESVAACIPVIESKDSNDSGSFWTWENKVCLYLGCHEHELINIEATSLVARKSRANTNCCTARSNASVANGR